jgi:hypothetical protein
MYESGLPGRSFARATVSVEFETAPFPACWERGSFM